MSRLLPAALAAVLATPVGALAQGGDGYLFRRPTVQLLVRGGYALPRAESEIFAFTRQRLTVDKRDFYAGAIGGELDVRLSERVDLALGIGYAQSTARSEFRDWVDQDGLPIKQKTILSRLPVTAGMKVYLSDRGRRISRFAWVPYKWAPYVGAGAGWVHYRFEQDGDFIDFETLDVFSDIFTSSGTTPTAHVFAGLDMALGAQFVLSGEARYAWASTHMNGDFDGFDAIDLAGMQATIGIGVRF
ncbi:MAG: outer membrane beta-barrel protein [Gemmatimonadetes bacterium]|nr:outer membrane beta-barrel protein [Gemmatimonadota bacterium]